MSSDGRPERPPGWPPDPALQQTQRADDGQAPAYYPPGAYQAPAGQPGGHPAAATPAPVHPGLVQTAEMEGPSLPVEETVRWKPMPPPAPLPPGTPAANPSYSTAEVSDSELIIESDAGSYSSDSLDDGLPELQGPDSATHLYVRQTPQPPEPAPAAQAPGLRASQPLPGQPPAGVVPGYPAAPPVGPPGPEPAASGPSQQMPAQVQMRASQPDVPLFAGAPTAALEPAPGLGAVEGYVDLAAIGPAPGGSGQAFSAPSGVVVAGRAHPQGGPLPLPFINEPDSPLAASFRVLRHRFREVGNPRAIAISSANAKDGKTTCAINLAMAFAEHSREQVLLLEANFRAPKVSQALNFQTPACFGEQMERQANQPAQAGPWKVASVHFPNLHVLAVDPRSIGRWMLEAPAFKAAIAQFRQKYPQIIIDCPTALGSADVNIVEEASDGVLLVARAGHTSSKSVQGAVRHLAPGNIFGIVLLGGGR